MNRLLAVLVLLAALMAPACASSQLGASSAAPSDPAREAIPVGIRGVWLTNVDSDVLTSRAKIAEAMDFLAAHNFNVVYPVVWNGGKTLYPSDIMEREFGTRIDPRFAGRDPLQEVIEEGHRVGLEVIPWFEYGFADSYAVTENAPLGPMLSKHPEWKAIDPDGKLVEKNKFRWANAFDPEVQAFLTSLVIEVATKYDVDGIQGDDRMPALPSTGGYDARTVAKYKAQFGTEPPRDYKDAAWVKWRADILTDWFADLRRQVKAVDPNLVISSSPSYYDWSLTEYLQDSYTWTNKGIVDSIHPQAYRYNVPAYRGIVDKLVAEQFTREQLPLLAPGILIKLGKYRIPADDLMQCIEYNRTNGIRGEVFFFYPGLRENDNELATRLKEHFYAEPARLPWRTSQAWRPAGIVIDAASAAVAGPWTPCAADPSSLEVAGGASDAQISYGAEVPQDGTYAVYVRACPGPSSTKAAAWILKDAQPVTLDQTAPSLAQWTRVGEVELKAGEPQIFATLKATELQPDRMTCAGPVMLLMDRRATNR